MREDLSMFVESATRKSNFMSHVKDNTRSFVVQSITEWRLILRNGREHELRQAIDSCFHFEIQRKFLSHSITKKRYSFEYPN